MNAMTAEVTGRPSFVTSALDLASLDLYGRNAFRILQLPVEASERDVTRRREFMEKAARSKLDVPPGPSTILPRNPSPDEFELRDAARAILDAEQRLVHEFFWFWPLQAGSTNNDPALRRLASGDLKEPIAIWKQKKPTALEEGVAKHNLAILCHYAALEVERKLLDARAQLQREQSSSPAAASAKGEEQWNKIVKQWEPSAESFWSTSVAAWASVLQSEVFWSQVTARIRSIDDKSLTTGTARRLQQTLPAVLALIDVRLAIRALELGEPRQAQRHIARYRNSGLPKQGVDEALRLAIEPTRSYMKSLRKGAETEVEANSANGDAVADRLIVQSETPLGIVDTVLPTDHAIRQAERDQLALGVLSCLIQFGNKTENWKRTIEMLDRTAPIAASATTRDTIAKSRATALQNLEGRLCWFCGSNEGDEKCAVTIPVYGEVRREPYIGGTRVRWSTAKLKINKCRMCLNEQNQATARYASICIIGGILGVAASFAVKNLHIGSSPPGPIAGLIAGVAVGIGISIFFGKVVAPAKARKRGRPVKKRRIEDFPRLKELRAQGWARGEGPTN